MPQEHRVVTGPLDMTNAMSAATMLITSWWRQGASVSHKFTNWAIIDPDNGLSPAWCQAITWTDAGILLIRSLGTNVRETLIKYNGLHTRKWIWKYHLQNGAILFRPECVDGDNSPLRDHHSKCVSHITCILQSIYISFPSQRTLQGCAGGHRPSLGNGLLHIPNYIINWVGHKWWYINDIWNKHICVCKIKTFVFKQ